MFAQKKKKDLRKAREAKAAQYGNDSDENSNEEPDDFLDTHMQNNWWKNEIDGDELDSLYLSNKMILLFELLKSFQIKGEKWYVVQRYKLKYSKIKKLFFSLIFSAFVSVLNMVEFFMGVVTKTKLNGYGCFETGKDYLRLDGSTSKATRHEMVQIFNNLATSSCRDQEHSQSTIIQVVENLHHFVTGCFRSATIQT